MTNRDRPRRPEDAATASGLPQPAAEFRRELLRRLALLGREIQALDTARSHRLFLASIGTLRAMERELRQRLADDVAAGAWAESRVEIMRMWRLYRQAFERLATECQERHAARPGRRERGPRW